MRTVDLSSEILFRECSKNNYLGLDNIYDLGWKNREENIHEVFGFRKFNDDFIDTLSCYNDGDSIIGMVRFNYYEFLNKLLSILNVKVDDNYNDDDNLTNKMLDRLRVLKSIRTELELRVEFPILYKDLTDGRKYIRDAERLGNRGNTDSFYGPIDYYYKCGLQRSLDRFIQQQSRMYERFINNRHELKERYENGKSLNNYLSKVLDLNKFYLYVMYEYIKKCELSNDRDEILFYINLINKYIDSDLLKNVEIVIDYGEVFNIGILKERLELLNRRLKDRSSIVNWELVPPGVVSRSGDKSTDRSARVTIFSIAEVERLKKIGREKNSFYESSGYYAKAIGLRKYNGYLAYIYENGEVLLDTEFRDDCPNTAIGNSIYNIKVRDFLELSRLDKTSLMNNPRVVRIVHRGNWIKRVCDILDKSVTEESSREVKELIKYINRKNKD